MKTKLLFAALACGMLSFAQSPIFTPSMAVTSYGSVSSPFGEEVDKIIDGNVNTKFLDFNHNDGMGFTVNLGATAYVATSITVTTANDAVGRDPQNFEVLGSNDGTNFTSIATGTIPCVATRFHPRTFNFSNDNGYLHYRIIYSTQCSSENSLQIAETQLNGETLSANNHTLLESSIQIVPNPNNGRFTFNNSNNVAIDSAILYDLSGKRIAELNINTALSQHIQLDVESGIYFLNITSHSSNVVKKIIVH
jgi:hypothetical protein